MREISEEEKQIFKSELHETVVQRNDMLQKCQYNLSANEQKIVLYLISKISMYDKDIEAYDFEISNFCKVCGMDGDSGKNYKNLRDTIKALSDKSFYYPTADGKQLTLMRWIEKPYFDYKSETAEITGGHVRLKLDRDMVPYLIQLHDNFTRHELLWIMGFKSKYSIRLYRLMLSYQYNNLKGYEKEFTLDQLRTLMGVKVDGDDVRDADKVDKYPTFHTFKIRVLDPAMEEINRISNKTISYRTKMRGRKVTSIIISITSKGSVESAFLEDGIEKDIGVY